MDDKMKHLAFQNLNCEINYWHRKGTTNKWVLFFHGAGVDHEMFDSQFEVLDYSYNLIAWDARGHGLSKLQQGNKFKFKDMISDCKKLYEIHNIDKAILIGQSMGGNLAQEIAYYYPELVEKLVLIDCTKNTGKLSPIEKWSLKSSKFIFKCCPWNILKKGMANSSADKDKVKKYVEDCFEKLDKERFINIITELAECLHEDSKFVFKQPILLLCGVNEKLVNVKKVGKSWGRCDENCTFHIIDNAAHNSNQDNSEMVNRLICTFLSS